MTKKDLVKMMADEAQISQAQAAKALDTFCTAVSEADKVTLVGFGTFERRLRKARVAKNPVTGADVQVASRNVLAFRASKTRVK